jgi:CBS domain-containing protein
MRLLDLLRREHIAVPLAVDTLDEATAALVERLAATGAIHDPAPVDRWVASRRTGETVSIVPNVALPHFRTEAVDRLAVALGVAPHSLGGVPGGADVRIVALILAPPESATVYLQTVSALVRLFRDAAVIDVVLGARSPDDILALPQLRSELAPHLCVRDIMIHHAAVIPPDAGVRDAVDVMLRERVRALPVVDDSRSVLGILSEWDVMRALLPQIPRADAVEAGDAAPAPARVRDVMTRSVLCVPEDMVLEEAANLMINKDVEQFPVVREGKLTGFLTRTDIIRKLFAR